jgi:hypothetical protein
MSEALENLMNAAETAVSLVPLAVGKGNDKWCSELIDQLKEAVGRMNIELNNKAIEENKATTEMRMVPTVSSLRDHFAGLAMQGIISLDNHRVWQNTNGETLDQWRDRLRLEDATLAYAMADAMLKARQQ